MLSTFSSGLFGGPFWLVFKYVLVFYPIWVPIVLGIIFWNIWLQYIRALYRAKTEMVVLDIKLPKEILKSPLAMEIALNVFSQVGDESTFIDKYWKGQYRAVSSLELVSIDGEVHFYMWIRKSIKHLVEAALYGQYPNIEVYEVPDYTKNVVFNPATMGLWGTEFVLTKPDPYPIKTYVDYGLDEDPKEEFKNDPLTALIEFLGSLKKGEQVWYQIIIRAHRNERRWGILSEKYDWKKDAKDVIKDIIANATNKPADKAKGSTLDLSKGEEELIGDIERNISKTAFDCGFRGIYFGNLDVYSKTNIPGLVGSFLHFNSNTANGFKPSNITNVTYSWQDFGDIRINGKRRRMMNAFKRRDWFFKPVKRTPFVLSSEELATLYHFPGEVAGTPTFTRIPSKKSQAPSNLPI